MISIGDALRPGATADAHDEFHLGELVVAARLAKRAVKAGVQVMIEGPRPRAAKRRGLDHQAGEEADGGIPYYVLGPPSTDVAAPYDHIASAVSAALASASVYMPGAELGPKMAASAAFVVLLTALSLLPSLVRLYRLRPVEALRYE